MPPPPTPIPNTHHFIINMFYINNRVSLYIMNLANIFFKMYYTHTEGGTLAIGDRDDDT